MPGPHSQKQAKSPVDPHGLLLRLALAPEGDDDLTEAELESAVELLAAPGGLAYAYRVLEDASLLREHLTDGPAFDDDAPVQNALTGLLLNDELELYDESGPAPLSPGAVGHSAPAEPAARETQNATRRGETEPRQWSWFVDSWRAWTSLGSVALAAALLIFFVPNAEPAGVKGIHQDSFFSPPLRLLSGSAEGPVQERSVLQSMTLSVPAFARCAPTPVVWAVSFTIAPDGIARGLSVVTTLASGVDAARSDRISACFAAELAQTAFEFGSEPTVVQLSIAREGD